MSFYMSMEGLRSLGRSRPNCKAALVPTYVYSPPEPSFPAPPHKESKLTNPTGCRDLPRLGTAARRPLHLHRQAGRSAGAILPDDATPPRRPTAAENAQEFKHSPRARHFVARHQLPLEVDAPASSLQRVPALPSHPRR